jgi:glycosyltransferase involved in cell wall biosynthesis
MAKICIATGSFYHPQETQVRFHIEILFDGNVCVLSEHREAADPFSLEHHCWSPQRQQGSTVGECLSNLPTKLRSLAQHRNARVPYGAKRNNIIKFLNQTRPDATLAEFGNVAMRIAPVANQLGVPMFTYCRGADASSQLRMPLRAAAYKRMMTQLDGLFSVSQFRLDKLSDKGVSHPNSHVVPSGGNTDMFQPSRKRPGSFLAVGQLIEKKRPDITVNAFCEVAQAIPDISLDVVGVGPMLEKCRAITHEFAMEDRITFHGARPHDFVKDMLSTTTVFLQHSVRAKNGNTEGLPTAIQEAMSCGLVIISTKHAGIPEAVTSGQNGYLVCEGDLDGFREAIAKVASSSQLVDQTSQRNRAKAVAGYDNRKLIKTVEQEILKVLKSR